MTGWPLPPTDMSLVVCALAAPPQKRLLFCSVGPEQGALRALRRLLASKARWYQEPVAQQACCSSPSPWPASPPLETDDQNVVVVISLDPVVASSVGTGKSWTPALSKHGTTNLPVRV